MTIPAVEDDNDIEKAAPHLIVTPFYKDPVSGATFVHRDLNRVAEAWEEDEHIGPVKLDEKFGDVESFVAYVTKHGKPETFLTWSARGLQAVIDYPQPHKWIASHPFRQTPEFTLWSNLATGKAIPLKEAVEFLEDRAPDIYEPESTALLTLLRALKSASADVQMRPDGTAAVKFEKDTTVRGQNDVELPAEITVAIPVLRGHVDDQGALVRYALVLKLRATVGADAHLALRFTMPLAERVLEEVYEERVFAERVAAAQTQLDGYTILRAAD